LSDIKKDVVKVSAILNELDLKRIKNKIKSNNKNKSNQINYDYMFFACNGVY
jgi:hypothetical protein